VLIGVGAVVVVIGVGAALAGPKFLKSSSSDPGCTTYTATALPAYNHAITDLNAQAPKATLTGDLATASSELSTAVSQAQSASVRAALQNLLAQVNVVRADVQSGKVAGPTVAALNAASTTADKAC